MLTIIDRQRRQLMAYPSCTWIALTLTKLCSRRSFQLHLGISRPFSPSSPLGALEYSRYVVADHPIFPFPCVGRILAQPDNSVQRSKAVLLVISLTLGVGCHRDPWVTRSCHLMLSACLRRRTQQPSSLSSSASVTVHVSEP